MSWPLRPSSPSSPQDPHANQRLLAAGTSIEEARLAMIMVHGRGAGPADILGLARALRGDGIRFLAPEAAGWSWYPQGFMAPRQDNEPALTSALTHLEALVDQLETAGLAAERLVLMGFSQGACLSLELALRRPRRYAAVVAYSGGLMGEQLAPPGPGVDLAGTPVFLGCSDCDPHIPLPRVQASSRVMADVGGDVTERIYPGMPHTINPDEIDWLQQRLDALAAAEG